ncbi:MAG: 50S ribosomal protein L21 [Patescibacteria group bacterium]|nr:50S ribosomal protein L21 [Patescibacteria group bacterium]MBU2509488.1 50S ribosomal protein L21 [Patescibacteria group bacterium]
MIAVIKTGGKQYVVKQDDVLKIEKLTANEGDKVSFETLLIAEPDGSKVEIGTPELGTKVEGEIVEHGRGKKISVVKYKAKSRYRRRVGHRQPFTKVKITKVA